MSPIYIFCAVLCVQSVYRLLLVLSKYFHLTSLLPPALTDAVKEIPQPSESVMYIAFFTLTSVFSSLAIVALFSIDYAFHDDLEVVGFVTGSRKCKYLSNLKFWGVKIFVTIEFTLEIGMMVVTMDEVQKQLMYNACMGSLCFFVSLVHLWAYAPQGNWIAEESVLRTLDEEPAIARTDSNTESEASGVSLQPTRDAVRLPENSQSKLAIQPPGEIPTSIVLGEGLLRGESARSFN